VRPAKPGSFAGVLFFHWLGRPKGDRTQFLEEAISLAKQGTVSLLIQGHFPWKVDPSEGMTDRQLIIDETIEVRRALDLLLSQPMVDRKRIAYVGHDYGAMYGSLAAGIEKRVKTYVLIAGLGTFADWSLEYWLKTKPDDFKKSYVQSMQGLDPISSINRATPAALLFQFANLDTFIKREEALAFYRAASSPKQIKWYQTTHEMDLEAARNDRRDWLTEKLRLRS
jgi:predicted esterase